MLISVLAHSCEPLAEMLLLSRTGSAGPAPPQAASLGCSTSASSRCGFLQAQVKRSWAGSGTQPPELVQSLAAQCLVNAQQWHRPSLGSSHCVDLPSRAGLVFGQPGGTPVGPPQWYPLHPGPLFPGSQGNTLVHRQGHSWVFSASSGFSDV